MLIETTPINSLPAEPSFCLIIFSVASLLSTVIAIKPIKIGFATLLSFVIGLLISELAWVHLIVQSLVLVYSLLADTSTYAYSGAAIACLALSVSMLLKIHIGATNAHQLFESEFNKRLGNGYLNDIVRIGQEQLIFSMPEKKWLKPFSMKTPGVKKVKNIPYGDDERHVLDIIYPDTPSDEPAPVLIQVHGGGWTIGDKKDQGQPLANYLASKGWVVVLINYQLSPKHRFPAHIVSVKKAIAWVRSSIETYGGNPDFIAITGGSAGGHLSSLAA